MDDLRDCYRLLEVGEGASAEEIRSAYMLLVNVWHPDRFAHEPRLQARASERIQSINGAFARIRTAPLRAPREPGRPERSAAEWLQIAQRLTRGAVAMRPGETLSSANVANLTQHVEGLRAYQEALRLQPDLAEAWHRLGLAHAQIHEYTEAVGALREAVRLRPAHAAVWVDLGASLAQLDRHPEVVEAFREALRLRPDDASAWFALGAACAHPEVRRYTDAEDAYRRTVALRPDLAEAWLALGSVCLKRRSLGHDDGGDAVRSLREAVSLRPDLADAWTTLGLALAAEGAQGEAVGALRQAVRLVPDSVPCWYALGDAARALDGRPGQDAFGEAYAELLRLDRREAARLLETLPRFRRYWLALSRLTGRRHLPPPGPGRA
jgi:tetratricopeptide (TPR) repeat protein